MASPRIVVVGGGPAGLLVARLFRRQRRGEVVLYERNPSGPAFGFGVALHHHALDRLEAVDPEAHESLQAIGYPLRRWIMQRGGERVEISNDGGLGVSRAAALARLTALATRAGVEVRAGREASPPELAGADLVVAADGVGSAVRERLASELGVRLEPVAIPYVWLGAPIDPGGMLLASAETADGLFTAHVMPYAPGKATFQVDTEPAGGEGAGLAHLETAFADVLGGRPIEGNRSRWSTFTTVRCERWWHGNTVLVGDAAHTAHYTVGSGTRMAMEDAIALAAAVDGEGSLADGFAAYERGRRPAVERLQERARRSQRWWASLRSRFDLPLPTLLLSYFTRTGSIELRALERRNPRLLEDCRRLAGRAEDRLLSGDRGRTAELPADGVEAWSPAATALCRQAASLGRDGAEAVCLTGPPDREAVLERLDLAEQLRRQAGVASAVAAPRRFRDDLTVGVLASRIDYAVLT